MGLFFPVFPPDESQLEVHQNFWGFLQKKKIKKKELPVPQFSHPVRAKRKLQPRVWCKILSQIQGNSVQSLIKAGGTGMMNEFSWNMIRVQLRKLQLNDSGENHLGSHFQGRNKPRNSTELEVWAEFIKE